MIDYPKIYAFCEVASCLSFTEAASRLYMTQSSLSKIIASLEKTLGCQLFSRNNRTVSLTPAGEYLYGYYKEALIEMQRASDYARGLGAGKYGHMTIGVLGLSGIVREISAVFLEFHEACPMYSFDFMPMTLKESRDLLISKKIDAVITKSQDIIQIPGCRYAVMATSRLVAIARYNHPLFDTLESPTLADLKDYEFAVITPGFSMHTYRMIYEVCGAAGFEPRIMSSENSAFGMMMHVAASDYIGIADEFDCRGRDTLRQIPIKDTPSVETVLAWNKGNISKCLGAFIGFVTARGQSSAEA